MISWCSVLSITEKRNFLMRSWDNFPEWNSNTFQTCPQVSYQRDRGIELPYAHNYAFNAHSWFVFYL